MREFLNQYSYYIVVIVVLAVALLLGWRAKATLTRTIILSGLLLPVAMAPFILHTGKSSLSSSPDLETALHSGIPTLVEVYSDF